MQLHTLFYSIYKFFNQNKRIGILVGLVFLFSCGYLGSRITFNEDITRIIPKNEKADVTTKVLKQLNFSDNITVIIEKNKQTSLDEISEFAQEVYDSLSQNTTLIKEIQGYVDADVISDTYSFVNDYLPLFLTPEDYKTIDGKIKGDSIEKQVASNYNQLLSPTGFVTSRYIQQDPLGLTMLGLKKLQQNSGTDFKLINGFITSADSTKILLFIKPKIQSADAEVNADFSEFLYGVQETFNVKYQKQGKVSFYGSALIADANAKQIKHDITSTIIISMVTLMVLLILFYRKISIPIIIFIPTVFAGALALAVLFLFKNTISAISLGISAVLVGITIDYALHILTHYKHKTNVEELYKEITKPLIMSASTNAVAFLCLLFVHSDALIDLGIFASVAIFSSAIFSLLIIPHIYKPKTNLEENSVLDKVAAYPFEKNKYLIIGCLVAIGISIFTFNKVGYNNNLSDLNFVPPHLKEVEKTLDTLTNNQAKSLYIVSYGNSLNEALQTQNVVTKALDKAKDRKEILQYTTLNKIIKPYDEQSKAFDTWNHYWYNKRDFVEEKLKAEGSKYGFDPQAHAAFYSSLYKSFEPLSLTNFYEVKALASSEFISENHGFYTISTLVKVKEKYRTLFLEEIEKNPNVVCIDRKQLNETFLGKLKEDFSSLIDYSFIAVVAILWIFFRRIEWVLFSIIPILLTGLVTTGLMGLFGIEFNIFSAIVCTLVFGHGIDFSIFMTSALQKEFSTGKNELQTYRTSIILAVLTTVLAIGALIFAKHPALLSIASVSLIGVFSAVIITFVFYPLLFKIFVINRVNKGLAPFSFINLIVSILFFIYYGLGSLVISVFGRILFKILPIPNKNKLFGFSKIMSIFMRSVIYLNPFLRSNRYNPFQENFEKPAVIIANHTSFLDTLTIGMYLPKVIFLVNDWVWNSPFFGRIIRVAGFYPVSMGYEKGPSLLKDKIEMGYSIMVFPEGTRSYDNTVKRFHKGAFYLAQQLQLDILPLYIHGNSEALPKGDFVVNKNTLSTIIGERIPYKPDETYAEKAKIVSKIFKSEFDDLRARLESKNYFTKKIIQSFLYKETEIYNLVKQDVKKNEETYYALNSFFSTKESILHLADNYGQIDFVLALQHSGRKITSCINDEDKRAIACSNYLNVHRNIKFVEELPELGSKLLLSKTLDGTLDEANKLSGFAEIICLNNLNNIQFFLALNYKIIAKQSDIIHLRKSNEL